MMGQDRRHWRLNRKPVGDFLMELAERNWTVFRWANLLEDTDDCIDWMQMYPRKN